MKTPLWMLTALVAAGLVAGCGSETTTGNVCDPGEDITVDQQPLCVVEQAVVIETGFTCPPIRPERYTIDDFVCCGRITGLSDSLLRRAIVIYKQRRGLALDDADAGSTDASDATDTAPDRDASASDSGTPDAPADAADADVDRGCDEPAAIDNDGDGWCGALDCDDRDPTAYPGAPEAVDGVDNDCDGLTDEDDGVSCAEDADCPRGQFCRDGVCGPR